MAPDYINKYDIFWILFNWEGPHRVDVMAASFEYYRFIFAIQQSNPTTGDVARAEGNVNGGIGCFGAVAVHSFYMNMAVAE